MILIQWVSGALKSIGLWLLGTIALPALAAEVFTPVGAGLFSIPELKGLRFRGGLTISVELVAILIGIVLYGAAYVGEIVRGGLAVVSKGLVEAGESLGLGQSMDIHHEGDDHRRCHRVFGPVLRRVHVDHAIGANA